MAAPRNAALVGLALLVLLLAAPVSASAAPNHLDIGVQDPLQSIFEEHDPIGVFKVLHDENVSVVRIPVAWAGIAPTAPADATDYADPAYHWSALDARIRTVTDHGMRPLLYLYVPPQWALKAGSVGFTPRPGDFQAFAQAISTRYSGKLEGLPRVRYWQIWNEPNLKYYLDHKDNVADYRALLNAAYPRIHAAAAGNLVVAGGQAPFGGTDPSAGTAPLAFMRRLLCVTRALKPAPGCTAKTSFDVWDHHPYTSGGPNHHALARDDVSLGDLPEMAAVLKAAGRAHHIKPHGSVPFWISEFSWDTSPPDPHGVPVNRQARWVAEALYRMWSDGISLMVWLQVRDDPKATAWRDSFQAGMYYRTTDLYANERIKPVAKVLKFPFVALPDGRTQVVWGRTPDSAKHRVAIEQARGSRWVRVASPASNGHGIFRVHLRSGRGRVFRARVGKTTSLPFKAVKTRDVPASPFGGPTPR